MKILSENLDDKKCLVQDMNDTKDGLGLGLDTGIEGQIKEGNPSGSCNEWFKEVKMQKVQCPSN